MSQNQTPHQDKIFVGIACGLASFFLLAVMSVCAKLLSEQHHVIDIIFYRNFIAVVPFFAYIWLSGRHELFKTKKPFLVGARTLAGTIGLFFTFAAWEHLPLTDATVIFFTATLLGPALCFFFLKEHIGPRRWAAIFVGMAGVLLIVQPSGEFSMIGVIFAVAAAISHAVIHTILRALKTESHLTTTFYFIFISMLVAACFMPFIGKFPAMAEWPLILLLGASGGSAQILMAAAFRFAPASLVMPLNYTGLIWASGFDILIWHVVPGLNVWAGAVVIIGANIYIAYREHVRRKEKS